MLDQLENALLEYIEQNAINKLNGELSADLAQNIANIYDENGEYLSVLLGENGDPNFLKNIKAVVKPVLTDTLIGGTCAFNVDGRRVSFDSKTFNSILPVRC